MSGLERVGLTLKGERTMLNRDNQGIAKNMNVAHPSWPGRVFKIVEVRNIGNNTALLNLCSSDGYVKMFNISDDSVVFRSHNGCYKRFCEISGGK